MGANDAARDGVSRLIAAWGRTDTLLSWVDEAHWTLAPLPDRHALLHELGHTVAWAFQRVHADDGDPPALDGPLDDLFLRGAPRPGEPRRPQPPVDVVRRYVGLGRERVLERLTRDAAGLPDVLTHELLHHEILLAMLAAVPGAGKRPPPGGRGSAGRGRAAERRAVRIDDGDDAPLIDSTPVMVGEFFEFVQAGGYAEARWWSREAWAWRAAAGRRHPLRWRQIGGEWLLSGLVEDLPLTRVFDWPAAVTLGEARAYLAWVGARLPRPEELLRAGRRDRAGQLRSWPWGEQAPDAERCSLGPGRLHPDPVGHARDGASDRGVHDLVGNGWEWTDEPALTADGEHAAWVEGGSWASDPELVRRRPRLVLPSQASWLETQFRAVRPASA